ncbi:TonB-dependent receptor [Parahaliea maris]|uniref:TonB-dependent receptor n=1 Tax=Parahaliea maris TaxID=2716870 RepID=A0A5C8ZSW7_9GAMM|nr:TonB-dependent receptor [Parahaliea maris]TXS90770.1 TonB-dependent receptor [Parahaliea maris]
MNTRNAAPALKHTLLFRALTRGALPLACFASVPVMAEVTQNSESELEHVLVVGQGASLDKALREQRRADSIKSVVSADAMAQMPDENVAEALQRLPGVSIERDQGEGRFVSVRGLGPDLNSVQINGTVIPSPNSGTRAVALDVVPSELVETLSVVKAVTPDMDANSLGGSVAVESLSAFDRDGRFYSLAAESNYDDNVGETSPKLSGVYSDLFSIGGDSENLGVALAFSWQERDFGSDNVETGGGWDFDEGARLEESEMRDYIITRERSGLGLNLDYRVSDSSKLYLRTLYSEFTDTEIRNAAGVEFADAQQAGEQGDAEGWRELKDREETQEIASFVFGGEWDLEQWSVTGQLGYSRSSEDTPGHIAGAVFEGDGDFTDTRFSSGRKPVLVAADSFYDPSAFVLEEVEWGQQKTTDTEQNIRFDIARSYQASNAEGEFKFGGKYSTREKDNDTNVWKYEDFADYGISDDALLLSTYAGGEVDYSLGRFGPGIKSGGIARLIGGLDAEEFYDEEESRIEDFVMDEDITAAYLMNTLEWERLRMILGVRYEGTEFSAEGTGLRDDVYEAVNVDNDYDHWLPGAHLRYQLGDDTQLRAAWTNTVVRPTFEQVAPGFVIDGDEASFGNPDLDALESANFDLGVEHFLGRAGVLSAFVFYKEIDNFIYQTDIAGTGAWADFDEAETFANGDSADLYGLELSWSQQLGSLPAPWNGLLLGANFTYSRSDATLVDGDEERDIDLPYQSDRVGNAMVGWENNTFSVRLSANYKSSYLQEVSTVDDPEHDLFVDAQTFVDLTVRWYVTPQLQLSFEAQNITDEPYYVYTGSRGFNAQYEEYGPSFKLGITLTSM